MYSALLIDDEPWALRGLKSSYDWADHGFGEVLDASSSYEAIDYLHKSYPDVVISDIRMPDLSGIDILKYARSHQIESEFIFISGFSEFAYAQEAVNNGAFAYLLKPIDVQLLSKTLENLCARLQEKKRHNQVIKSQEPEQNIHLPGYLNKNFIDLLNYVNMHFSDNITLPMLSNKYHLNQTYISDLFKKTTGKSFSKYLLDLRIKYACTLLKDSHMPIQEVSIRSGYRNYCNFIRAFKQVHKIAPAKYRNGDENC